MKALVGIVKHCQNIACMSADVAMCRSGVERVASSDNYTAHVSVRHSRVAQSGQYHCAANPGQSRHVTVHVHHGESRYSIVLSSVK